jgi:hypothetical protein
VTKDINEWNNMIARVVAMGPMAFRHARYKQMGVDVDKDPPLRVGELIMTTARVPFRFWFSDKVFIVINDDQWFCKVPDEETVSDGLFRFT